MTEARSRLLVIVAAWAIGTLPFAGKAFHVDDPYYLLMARQVRADPLRPYSFEFLGSPAYTMLHPPLVPYMIAGVVALDGGREREVPLHLAVSVFSVVGALALWDLARRFRAPQALVVLTILLSPTVLPGTNLMLDLPALALASAAFALHVRGTDTGSRSRLLWGGILAGLAILTKYNCFVILPVMAAYSLLERKPSSLKALLAPAVLLALWTVHNVAFYGKPHLLANLGVTERSLQTVLKLPRYSLCVIGASIAWLPLAVKRERASVVLALAAVLLGLVIARRAGEDRIEQTIFFANGLAALFAIALRVGRDVAQGAAGRRDDAILAIWALAVLSFGWLVVPFQAVRHYIAALAPLLLLLLRGREVGPLAQAAAVTVTAAAGLLLAAADAELAGVAPRFAHELTRAAASPERAGGRVWFRGGWNWCIYAPREGFSRVTPETAGLVRTGDLLVFPLGQPHEPLPPGLEPRFVLSRVVPIPRRIPLRTQVELAGYYLSGLHDAPYAASRGPIEEFGIYTAR